MRYKVLGRTGVQISDVCLGAMTFGGTTPMWQAVGALDEKRSSELVARALDAGVNFFDTANGYGDGESEVILGRALAARRKEVVIATKVGFPTGTGPNDRGLARSHIHASVDASLRRLGTDFIDLYFVHKRDPLTPVDETMRALDDLVRWGKVRYLGVSNWPAWQIMRANGLASSNGWARFECVQAYYNLAARELEREILPFCEDQGIGITVWSPLAGGVLTGKYGRDGTPPAGARRNSFDIGPVDFERVNRIVDIAREIAQRKRATIAAVCLAWLLVQPAVTSVIVGARRMDQLEDNLAAESLELSREDLARLGAASALPVEYPGWFLERFDPM